MLGVSHIKRRSEIIPIRISRRLESAPATRYRSAIGCGLLLLLFILTVHAENTSTNRTITCLGRIEPEDGVIHLAAPYSVQGPSLLSDLLVKEGDWVKQGQIIANTCNQKSLEADYLKAEQQVKVAQYKLTRVKAGEKNGDIAAQKADFERAQVQLSNAERDLKRSLELFQKGALSESDFDRFKLAVDTARKDANRAQEKLDSISEVRKVDVDPATYEVEAAMADAKRARADWEQTFIRSPINGQIIKIYARAGELVGPSGVVEIARTDSMFVQAEVYETDIRFVKKGQRADIEGESFAGKITGVVEQIGLKIGKNDVLKTDPAAYSDARVVEVKIRLDDSKPVAGLIHAQVNVRVLP